MDQRTTESVLAADALLLGRRTYELFASYWPRADLADRRTRKLNGQPKYVASRTLRTAELNNSTVLDGNVVERVAELSSGRHHMRGR